MSCGHPAEAMADGVCRWCAEGIPAYLLALVEEAYLNRRRPILVPIATGTFEQNQEELRRVQLLDECIPWLLEEARKRVASPGIAAPSEARAEPEPAKPLPPTEGRKRE